MLQVKPWDILRMAWGLCRIRVIYFYHEWPSGRWKGFPRADLAAGCALLLLFFSLLIVAARFLLRGL